MVSKIKKFNVIYGNFLLSSILLKICIECLLFCPSSSIQIPSIPFNHIDCWLRNIAESDKIKLLNACNNNNVSLISDSNIGVNSKFCNEVKSKLINQKSLSCWGYEKDSDDKCLLYKPICDGSSQSWASDQKEQMQMFFSTADFGFVRQQMNELKYYCSPENSLPESSYLKCTKYLRFCRAKHIYIDLKNLINLGEPIRYRDDILKYGDIGGWKCNLSRNSLLKEGSHKSPLMSWFDEISNFKVLPNEFDSKKCDVTIEKPTFIMKLDATINMYHHFCDFINLYLSLHLNGSFVLDNKILIWDTHQYRSNFGIVWKAFTKNALLSLSDFIGKTVCFKNVIFPLLPRMIYGMYYNMPLIPGCRQSGVFRAFNRHLLFHLKLSDSEVLCLEERIKITFLKRQTKYRQILNQNQLYQRLKQTLIDKNQTNIDIQLVDFNHQMPFIDQIRISSTSDILIGIHGAGLTHTLFQPDYGVLFELYNCQDQDCYKDLARLRGVEYLTWNDPSKLVTIADESQKPDQKATGAAHAKFVNYHFDPEEFVKLTLKAIEMVIRRKKDFINNIKNKMLGYSKDEL